MLAPLTMMPEAMAVPVTRARDWAEGRPKIVLFPGPHPIWRLVAAWLGFCGLTGATIDIPAPFDFDGASVPRWFRWLISKDDLGVLAALIHDWLYRTGGDPTGLHGYLMLNGERLVVDRKTADRMFRRFLLDDGVVRWRAEAAYLAVRIGGRSSWRA